MASERLLLVDDDETLRLGLGLVLEASGYEVTIAPGVPEALHLIAAQAFDVLLTDLHMPPGPGDGYTVIAGMRQTQPEALLLMMSADPKPGKTSRGAAGQADEVFLKPVQATAVAQRIGELLEQRNRPSLQRTSPPPADEIALLLEKSRDSVERRWLSELNQPAKREPQGSRLTEVERTEHLPEALRDIIFRLRFPQPLGTASLFSMSALQHGARRRRQGAGAATLAEEARALQVALFRTLEANRDQIEPDHLLPAVMAIADEVNAQLLQAIEGYEKEDPPEPAYGFR